ncbi:conserved hypothetical protein [Culex quinquefasciatus]|uniref:C-type lectin domain-containing protein n=1 Tax=Culex quinquefasciatus TaxID=7176 RepID=B0WIQ7_CULQU|nr:conserved hypothetical protein [Culex quinquefasciatus]|eukprot:XP_001848591.1 conserved hypothetical protein [Culex quinquefasciatus]
MLLLQVAITIAIILQTHPEPICSRHRTRIQHRFHALRHCQRSNKTIIGLINVSTVKECAQYARKRHGMAFNFGPKGRNLTNLFDLVDAQRSRNNTSKKPPKGTDTITADPEEFYNCQVLDCPEYRNLSTVVNDTRFDYYSLYTRPARNATCLPAIGMFVLDDRRLNYSQAYNECLSMDGTLAHVVSDRRTVGLSRLQSTISFLKNDTKNATEPVFIGLNETVKNKFFTSSHEPLECFLYRAWAPGHPARTRQPGCVALSPNNSSWTVHNCNHSLRFICELNTSGPPQYEARLKRKCSVRRPNNRARPKKVVAGVTIEGSGN